LKCQKKRKKNIGFVLFFFFHQHFFLLFVCFYFIPVSGPLCFVFSADLIWLSAIVLANSDFVGKRSHFNQKGKECPG